MKFMKYVIETAIIVAILLALNYVWPVSVEQAGETRAVLYEVAELAIMFAFALVLYCLCLSLRGWREHLAKQTELVEAKRLAELQSLEHLCKSHEGYHGERSQFDPRGRGL